MAATSDFVVSLDTDKALNDESFARAFLSAWLNHPNKELRPERWGRGEPVRNMIAPVEFDQLVSEWCKVALMFKRQARPKMTVDVAWRRNKGLDPRPFPWGLTAWLAKNAGPTAVSAFLHLVIEHFQPAFASATTYEESRRKHFVRRPHCVDGRQVGMAEEFRGHHVLKTFPGIYWLTYLGPPAIERLGEQLLRSLPIGRIEPLGAGYLLTAYDDPSLIGSEQARLVERRIVEWLGKDRFFDVEGDLIPVAENDQHN
jgi:hypothetical protein